MSQKLYINGVDQSSYVVACSLIPVVVRARDYRPAFNGFNFSVSVNIPDEPTKGQSVYLEVDNNPHYLGFISKKDFNEDRKTWDLEVTHWLMKLEQYRVRYQDIHSDLVAGMIDSAATWETFTVDDSTDVIQKTAHGLSTGDKIQLKTSGTLPAPLEANHVYYVYVVDANSFKVFEDFAMYMEDTAWAGGDGSHGYVDITDAGSGTHEYTADLDQSKYNDWSFYRDIQYATDVSAFNDRLYSYLIPDNASYPMQPNYTINPDDEWNLLVFDCEDGGSIPGGLSKTRAYLAARDNLEGQEFFIYDNRSDFVSDTPKTLSSDGSGQQYFAVLRRKSGDADVWTTMPTAVIQLKHFIVTVFQKIGVVLDTSLIDNVIFYRYTTETQSYKWTEIYFMESLLYNINQNTPRNWADVDGKSQITLVELIQDIFQRLGLAIKFTGFQDDIYPVYKLYSQVRDEFGILDPSSEPQYVIPDNNQVDYSEIELIDDNGGWYYSHPLIGVRENRQQLAISFIFNNRKFRSFENDLEPYSRITDGDKAQLEDLSVKTNLVFFLLDKFDTNGSNNVYMIRDGGVLTGKELLINPNYSPSKNALAINGQYALLNHINKEIECQASFLSQDIWTIKEIHYDVSKERIKIVQEVNQLTSG